MSIIQHYNVPHEIYVGVKSCLEDHDEIGAVAILQSIKAKKEKQTCTRAKYLLHKSDLVQLAISFCSLTLVTHLFENYYAPEYIPSVDFQDIYILLAIEKECEDIALFLYSLKCLSDDRLPPPDKRVWIRRAVKRKLYRLLLTFLEDSTISLLDHRNFYDPAVHGVLTSNNHDLLNALLVRVGPHLNYKVSLESGPWADIPFYLFELLLSYDRIDVIEKIIEHPCVDLRTLEDNHLRIFFSQLYLLGHSHILFASVMLCLSHAQRKLAFHSWDMPRPLYLKLGTKTDMLNKSLVACVVPGYCESPESSNLSEEELQRDSNPGWFGRLAYKLLKYGQNIMGLFLLYQDGYVEGKLSKKWERFFNILLKLPLEMQMLMCQRLQGSAKYLFTLKEIDGSLRKHLEWFGMYG